MTGRPRPKARTRALNASTGDLGSTESVVASQTSDTFASQQAAKPKDDIHLDDEEDDDFFAHRRRLMRRVISRDVITPPPPAVTKAGSDSDEGGSAKKRKRSGKGDDNWVKSGISLVPEMEDEETISGDVVSGEIRPTHRNKRTSGDDL